MIDGKATLIEPSQCIGHGGWQDELCRRYLMRRVPKLRKANRIFAVARSILRTRERCCIAFRG